MGGNINRLAVLNRKIEFAKRELCRATMEELPEGTVIRATLGGIRITATVTGYYAPWSIYCGYVFARNNKTRRTRRVLPHYSGHAVEVVSLPQAGGAGGAGGGEGGAWARGNEA